MSTDYLSFFNLNDDPFRLTPDTAYFYNSPAHATALLSIEYCVTQKEGFCILTGEPGTGKTTIIRLFTEKWKDRAEIALVMTPRLSPDEFFRAILDDFKIPLSQSKNDMMKAFRGFLLTHAANDKRVAIIVDEAQELPGATLEELRLLSNLETEKEKLLQIILIGQPELRTKLLSEPLRQLNQRITVRVQLKPLSEAETSDYINTRLIKGGNSSLLFNQKAKDLIYSLSGGIPRTINLLASRGLMSAFLDGSKEVFDTHVQKGAADVMEPLASNSSPKSPASGERRPKNVTAASVAGPITGTSSLRSKSVIFAACLALAVTTGGAIYFFGLIPPFTPGVVTPEIAQSKPVVARISSARMAITSSSHIAVTPAVTSTVTPAVTPPPVKKTTELSAEDSLQSAFTSFNVLAQAWHLAPAAKPDKTDTLPEKFLEEMAAAKGMQFFYFYGTLDRLLYLGYPAIIVKGISPAGKEIYTALTKGSGNEFTVSTPTAAASTLSRKELEGLWHGKALVLWKNHNMIPPQITLGTRDSEIVALQKLLAHAGTSGGRSGVFDQKTERAIKSFQNIRGLIATGQTDPQTLLHLYKESTSLYRPKLK